MDGVMGDEHYEELGLLRAFFREWEYLHNIRTENMPENLKRMRMEIQAQKMMDAAHAVQAFNIPVPANG